MKVCAFLSLPPSPSCCFYCCLSARRSLIRHHRSAKSPALFSSSLCSAYANSERDRDRTHPRTQDRKTRRTLLLGGFYFSYYLSLSRGFTFYMVLFILSLFTFVLLCIFTFFWFFLLPCCALLLLFSRLLVVTLRCALLLPLSLSLCVCVLIFLSFLPSRFAALLVRDTHT